LTTVTYFCNDHRTAERGAESRVLTFLVDKGSTNGSSVARTEWRNQIALSRQAMAAVYGHLLMVDAGKSLSSPQRQGAQACPGTTPVLFWYDVGGIGVFYAYDGNDVMIVLAGAVSNPPPPAFADLHRTASGRL
jgi:hypothetical protein